MKRTTPALHLLHIFEAAARHENFKAASEELFLTPSAVSHQIKALEENLGIPLFQRKSRGVALNPAGEMYLKYVQQGLESFHTGSEKIRHRYASPTLKISCFTTLASNIIIPQLGVFKEKHPEIELRIETGNHVADLRYDDIDLAIRVGQGNWPNLVCNNLFDIKIAVICSREFAKKHRVRTYEDINQLPLIDLSYMPDIWKQWADAVGITLTNNRRAITFSDYDSSIRAAAQGVGLALAMFPIEDITLARGSVITAFSEFIPFQRSLYAVHRPEDSKRHDIECFTQWLKTALTTPQIDEFDSRIR